MDGPWILVMLTLSARKMQSASPSWPSYLHRDHVELRDSAILGGGGGGIYSGAILESAFPFCLSETCGCGGLGLIVWPPFELKSILPSSFSLWATTFMTQAAN